jgi:hypothetical protein
MVSAPIFITLCNINFGPFFKWFLRDMRL